MSSDSSNRGTENLQQFRMALALVEQRLKSLVGESSRRAVTGHRLIPTVESSGLQFRPVADRRSSALLSCHIVSAVVFSGRTAGYTATFVAVEIA